jgi:hypothetical protein
MLDLMIAATAVSAGLPLYTTNPNDFDGLERIVSVMPVTRPSVPSRALIQAALPGRLGFSLR